MDFLASSMTMHSTTLLAYPKAVGHEWQVRVDFTHSRLPANPTPSNSAVSGGAAAIESAERQNSATTGQ